MKKLAIIAALAFTSSAFASIHLTVRSDYVGTQKYTDAGNTDVGSTSIFTPSFARLYLNGKVGDADIKSGLDIRSYTNTISSGTSAISPTMTIDKFVHFLYLDKPVLAEGLRFQAGKLEINQGGWEHDQIEAGDSYLDSVANGGTAGATTTGGTAALATPGNMSGAGLSYAINDNHTVAFQAANQVNQTTNTTTNFAGTKRNSMGLSYTGWFMDKSLGVKAGYFNGAADVTGAAPTHTNEVFANAGVKYTMNALVATLDYLSNTGKTTGAADNKVTSWVLSANYTLNNIRPLIKYENSEFKNANDADNASSFKRNAFTVGVEFLTSDSLRWQVAYVNAADKNGSLAANDKTTFSQYIAGLKWDTDFLK